MEAIATLFFIYVGFYIAGTVIRYVASALGRGIKKVVTGKDTYFGPPQVKFIDDTRIF